MAKSLEAYNIVRLNEEGENDAFFNIDVGWCAYPGQATPFPTRPEALEYRTKYKEYFSDGNSVIKPINALHTRATTESEKEIYRAYGVEPYISEPVEKADFRKIMIKIKDEMICGLLTNMCKAALDHGFENIHPQQIKEMAEFFKDAADELSLPKQ